MVPFWKNKVVCITGTTSGIGRHVVQCAVDDGAIRIYCLNRPSERASLFERQARAKWSEVVTCVECDLASVESTKAAVATIRGANCENGIDVLVCNAAVFMTKDVRTCDGYDVQVHTNFLGQSALVDSLMPLIQKAATSAGEARVVVATSMARYSVPLPLEDEYFRPCLPGSLGGDSDLGRSVRYHMSKLAIASYAQHMSRVFAQTGSAVKFVTVDPGIVNTDLFHAERHGIVSRLFWNAFFYCFGQTVEQGSRTTLEACRGASVHSADMIGPKFLFRGPAVKTIDAGRRVKSLLRDCFTRQEQLVFAKRNVDMSRIYVDVFMRKHGFLKEE